MTGALSISTLFASPARVVAAIATVLLVTVAGTSRGQDNGPEVPAAVPLCTAPLDGSTLARFVDPLPIPREARRTGSPNGVAIYRIAMKEFLHQFHRDLPPTPVWGYGGTIPGPTLRVRHGRPVRVRWINDLPEHYPNWLPVPATAHGGPPGHPTAVRTVVHLHGAETPPQFDGFPTAWFQRGASALYAYANRDDAGATLWYHDHALGVTSFNVFAGLAGFYLVEGERASLHLPSRRHEIPLLLQSRSFCPDGRLYFQGIFHLPGHAFDTPVVNGKAWPRADVEPRRYRLRLLNADLERVYRLRLSNGMPLVQIGSDGGLLPAPVVHGEAGLTLGPSERADVIVDFSDSAGQQVELLNDATWTGLPHTVPALAIPELLRFDVAAKRHGPDHSHVPRGLPPLIPSTAALVAEAVAERTFTLDLDVRTGAFFINRTPFDAPVTEMPQFDSTEIWALLNLTTSQLPAQADVLHPVHVHLVQFRVLDRTPFDAVRYVADRAAGTLRPITEYATGPAVPAPPAEQGHKDTVRALPGEITRVVMRFKGYSGGPYVFHCHILPHEDKDMMRPFIVEAGTPVVQGQRRLLAPIGRPFRHRVQATEGASVFSASGLPAGLVMARYTGVISGTPETTGRWDVEVSATNAGDLAQPDTSRTGSMTLQLDVR